MCTCRYHVCGLPTAGAQQTSSQAPNNLDQLHGRSVQRPRQLPRGTQRRAASRACAALSSALQLPRHPFLVQLAGCPALHRSARPSRALRGALARLYARHAALVELGVDDGQQAAQQRVVLRHAHHLLPAHLAHLRGAPRGVRGRRLTRDQVATDIPRPPRCSAVAWPTARGWLPRTQGVAILRGWPAPSVLSFVAPTLDMGGCRTVATQDAALSLARLHWRLPSDIDAALADHTVLRLEHVQVFLGHESPP